MQQFYIEKHVPLPRPQIRPGETLYPWAKMSAGDSFFIPVNDADSADKIASSASNSGRHYVKKHGLPCRIATRKVEGGVRVWMVADNGAAA